MNKPAALFFAGFVLAAAFPAHAQEMTPRNLVAPIPERSDFQKYQTGQDFVTLNFTNIEIAALVKVLSEMTHRNFIIDERIKGNVTVMTPTKITPDEAYQVFLSALEIKGFTAIEDGKFMRIIPSAAARQSGLKVLSDGEMRGEGYVTKFLRLHFMNCQEAARTLMPFLTKDGGVIAYSITNSLILTDSVHNIRKLESLIAALDIPAQEGKGQVKVYYLRNANAENIAKVLTALLSQLPATTGTQTQQSAGTAAILEGTVTIAADKATNSLVIVGSPSDYKTIVDLIEKLDIQQRQVYVEAAIIEMSTTKQHELGFEFQMFNQSDGTSVNAVGGTNFGNIGSVITSGPSALATMNGLTLAAVKGSYTYNGVEYLNVGALLRALQSDGDVNILSTPNIVTMDNQKAEIMAGENIPVVTGQLQSVSTGSSISNSVERKDVGVTLRLTPQIMSDETVRLDIYQEISAVTTVAGLDANVVGPSTTKRTVSTSVVVKDGETIVIGGLMRDNLNSSMSKVPLLGDIPLFGWFFRYKTTKVEKTNLMIFITPTIIKNDNDAMNLTTQKTDAVNRFRDEHRMPKKDRGDITNSTTPEVKSTATGQLAPAPVEPRKVSTAPLQEPSEK